MKNISIILLLIITSLLGCKAQKPMDSREGETGDSTLFRIQMSLSPDHSRVLHQKIEEPSPANPFPAISYYVYDLKADSIVYQSKILRGNVSWHDAEHLKIWMVPGNVRLQESAKKYRYINIFTENSSNTTPAPIDPSAPARK